MGCHFLLQCMKVKMKGKSLCRVRLLATPWTAAHQAPLSMGFSRQEHWSGVPLPSPSAYLRLLIFLPAVLIPSCASSSPAFLTMYSAYKLNKQGDSIQPRRTPYPIGTSLLFQAQFLLIYHFLLEYSSVAPHSTTLAWKIPWTEEPGRLQSMGSLRVGHD